MTGESILLHVNVATRLEIKSSSSHYTSFDSGSKRNHYMEETNDMLSEMHLFFSYNKVGIGICIRDKTSVIVLAKT